MARVNRSRYAVLGMLSLGPASGYEVRRRLEQRVAPYWHESYGQIYPLLGQLVDEGLAEVTGEDGRGRRFALTDPGRAELVAWLEAPPTPVRGRNELLLKAFLGTEVSGEVLAGHIRDFRASLVDELMAYRANLSTIVERNDGRRVFSELTVTYGIAQAESLIDWCDRSLERLACMSIHESGGAAEADDPARRALASARGEVARRPETADRQ